MTIKRYRKKPIRVEAIQWDGTPQNSAEIVAFTNYTASFVYTPTSEKLLTIPTLEGTMTARIGDYIIKGIHGEFYPCKQDIFEESYYEEAE